MGISIKTLLEHEFFKDFHIVAGSKGIQKEVQGIAVMDAPDAYRWTKGKELVITSGYSILMEPDCIKKSFDEGLMQITSGMIIKRGRYLPMIPKEIIELFERYEIPLISMPFEIGYMEVMQQVNTIVMNRTIRRFQIHQNGAMMLGSTTYKVQKIKKILQAVEVEMGFPAFLYDVGEQEGYCSSANFKRISETYGLQESDYWNPKMEHNRYTLCDYIQMTRIRMFNEDNVDGPRISWILMPISIGGNLQAYFIVMESREFLDYYDEYSIRIAYLLLQSVYEQIVIAQSIGNIGFENLVLLALHSTGEDEERLLYQAGQQGISMNTRYTCVLFHQMNEELSARNSREQYIHSTGEDEERLLYQAGQQGISMNTRYTCVLFHQMNEELSARNSREQYITVFKNSQLSKNAKLAFLDENTGVVLTELSDSVSYSQKDMEGMISDFEQKIVETFPKMELEFAVLREGKKMSELKSSVETCGKVMKMGKKLCPKKKIWDYEMIGPFAWLQIPEKELEQMLSEYLDMMKDEKNVELLRTLCHIVKKIWKV